jgi:hypothetical protein
LIHFAVAGETSRSISQRYPQRNKYPWVHGDKFRPEPSIGLGVVSGFPSRIPCNPMELDGTRDRRKGTMWIAYFSIASAAAICLSVAAVMVQAYQGDILRS